MTLIMTLSMTLIMMKMKKAYEKANEKTYETGVRKRRLNKAYDKLGSPWRSLAVPWGCLGVPKTIFLDLSKIGRPIPSKWAVSQQPADKIEPRGTRETQLRLSTFATFATFPTQQVLLRAPFLHAPGARMTVVELTPSNQSDLWLRNFT